MNLKAVIVFGLIVGMVLAIPLTLLVWTQRDTASAVITYGHDITLTEIAEDGYGSLAPADDGGSFVVWLLIGAGGVALLVLAGAGYAQAAGGTTKLLRSVKGLKSKPSKNPVVSPHGYGEPPGLPQLPVRPTYPQLPASTSEDGEMEEPRDARAARRVKGIRGMS